MLDHPLTQVHGRQIKKPGPCLCLAGICNAFMAGAKADWITFFEWIKRYSTSMLDTTTVTFLDFFDPPRELSFRI
jgi:hypothetical protein